MYFSGNAGTHQLLLHHWLKLWHHLFVHHKLQGLPEAQTAPARRHIPVLTNKSNIMTATRKEKKNTDLHIMIFQHNRVLQFFQGLLIDFNFLAQLFVFVLPPFNCSFEL